MMSPPPNKLSACCHLKRSHINWLETTLIRTLPQETCDRIIKHVHFIFFHTYAVRDRIDLSGFSESCEKAEVFIADKLLPSQNDKKEIIENYTQLFIRVLMKHIPYFKKLGKGMARHITHEYYAEMSQRSEVIRMFCLHTLYV